MQIILLRDGGSNCSLQLSRQRLAVLAGGALVLVWGLIAFVATNFQTDAVNAEVVVEWRAKLSKQDQVVAQLERKSAAQSTAVGRQLAEMQARLLRMEAIGAHMVSELDTPEFDFAAVPAQGGPVTGSQYMLGWNELQQELAELSVQLRKRETELNILDSVLVSEEIAQSSDVSGRPVNWGWLSSHYGKRVDPITGKEAWHSGVDFAGHDGSDVIAVASGVVTYSGERSGYGRLIEISHANGFVTRYGHHKALLVATGDVVKKGDAIGKMGSSGRSTGPHVHFEVLKHGRTLDPAQFVARRF